MQTEVILGKYQIEEKLADKGWKIEFQGTDLETQQKIVITQISAELISAEKFIAQFELVAEAIQRTVAPAAAQLLAYGEHADQAVVIYEFVPGQTLNEMLGDLDGLPVNLVLDIAQQVGEYLEEIHRAGIVHGGLTPADIMLSSEAAVKILRAGLTTGLHLSTLVAQGEIEPTPFLAPEFRSGEPLSPQTDFYALGATLYQVLTGQPPELEITDPWPGSKVPGLPPELDELVANCLALSPDNRIQSAAEFLNGIAEVRKGLESGGQDTILGMEDALVGHNLGAYKLVERMGQGGMATVYKGYEAALDRYVAIKVLPQFFARDPNFTQRFRREAKAVAQLNHPSIVPIYSYGEESNITYIAMQHVPGGTLKQSRGQVYAPQEAIRLALPIIRALSYAHSRGIVHRDIKPSNVLLSDEGWPLLADFGLAKMAEETGQLTGTGVGVGTPMYMSPEQGQGVDVDHRTDIYSMGIMLYEMLTGDVPFRADTPMAIVIKHMTAPMPMPREINPNIPEVLERIILKATAKDSNDRYQIAEEMAIALEQAQNQLAVLPAVPAIAESPKTGPVSDAVAKKPIQAGAWLKKTGIALGGIVGVLLLGIILMWIFDICPPAGPWPIPPWCPGTSYKLPTIGGADEAVSPPVITEGTLGSILLQDDFEGEISSRWQFTSLPGLIPWAAEEIDGRTVMHSIPPDSQDKASGAEIRESNWENYTIQYDFRFAEPDQFGVYYYEIKGQITDCPPTISSLQAYNLTVSSDKVILQKSQCIEGGTQTLAESDRDIDPNEWHTLQYIFIGNRIQVIIDGDTFIDIVDQDEPLVGGGDLWLSIQGGAEIYVDNLKVYEIIPEVGATLESVNPESGAHCDPGQTLLLHEDFESGDLEGWFFADPQSRETEPWSIVDDRNDNFVLQADGHNWAYFRGFSRQDIEFRVRLRTAADEDFTHINFGHSEVGRYYLAVGDEVALYRDPGNAGIGANAYTNRTQWHEIKISNSGGLIKVYVDDQFRVEYQDSDPLPAGIIAIENTDGLNWYDDIVVCGLSETEISQDTETSAVALGELGFIDSGQDLGSRAQYAVALGDLDNDGDLDAVIGAGTWFNDGSGQFTLEANNLYPVAEYALADIDGDADLDILSVNAYNGANPIWTNMGGLQGGQIGVFVYNENHLGLESDSWTLAVGDLDGDGDLDAFVGNYEAPNEVWFNDGTGIFKMFGLLSENRGTRGVELGDVDGDGDLDIFEAGYVYCTTWRNDGSGTFEEYPVGHCEYDNVALALDDLDGDGDLDAYIGSSGGDNDHIKRNDGSGIFFESSISLTDTASEGLVLGDVDNDGDLDFIQANNYEPNEIWLNDGAGNLTYSGISLGANSFSSAVGDVDGDGDLDILFGNEGENKLWLNQFADGPSADVSAETALAFTDNFEAGFAEFWDPDAIGYWGVESEGNSNVLVAKGDMQIWIQNLFIKDFDFSIDFNFSEPADTDGKYETSFVFRYNSCYQYLLEILANDGHLIKISCTGDDSVQSFDLSESIIPGEWHQARVYMVGNEIKVWIDDELLLDFNDTGEPIGTGEFWISGQRDGAVTYFDNFSLEEIESSAGASTLSADQYFSDSGQRLGAHPVFSIAPGDYDQDGDLDIFAGNHGPPNLTWINDGTGDFRQVWAASHGGETYIVSPGDFDGDGDLDMVVANWSGPSTIWANVNQGDFDKSQTLTLNGNISQAFGADNGDLDGDGDLDIWLAAGGNNYVWLNDSSGTFTFSGAVYPGADSVGVMLGDINGDGYLDAFVANYVGGANYVFLNDGDGTFTSTGQKIGNLPSNAVALGDLDSDGDLDAFVANLEDQPNMVWFNDGSGSFINSNQQLGNLTSNAVALGDLDNDGDLDAYVTNGGRDNGTPQPNSIYFNDGTGNFTLIPHQANFNISMDAALLDLNADGWLDVVEATTDTIFIWFNEGDFTPESAETSILVKTWDGQADAWGLVVIPSGENILLGSVADQSGDVQDFGRDQTDSVKLAISEYGPIAGFSFEMLGVDSGCNSEGGKTAANSTLNHKTLVAIVGTTCSTALSEAMWIWNNAHIVFISPSASMDALSYPGLETFHRVIFTDAVNPSGESSADPNAEAFQLFQTEFETAFGRECCQPYAAEAYDAAMILMHAIEAVAGIDGDGSLVIPLQALAQTVRDTVGYPGITGDITFDSQGNRIKE
jgi:serine/threonine protein kinase/ABC-type branched-subunit amino acid transport system substrate-binding protein